MFIPISLEFFTITFFNTISFPFIVKPNNLFKSITLPSPSMVKLETISNSLISAGKLAKSLCSNLISFFICSTLPLLEIFFIKSSAVFMLTSTLEK